MSSLYFDGSDLKLWGAFAVLVAVMWELERRERREDVRRVVREERPGREVTLTPAMQDRLEDGETVRFTRWHGNDIVVEGDVVDARE